MALSGVMPLFLSKGGDLMHFNDWVKTYYGKATDYDGAYKAQCVDLIKLFEDKVLGLKPQACGDAWAYYANYNSIPFLKNNFIRIANTREFVPKKGDVVVWSKGLGPYGHIAVATGEGNTSYFYSYDQNWTGRHDPMTRIRHSYDYVYGVLRPKNQSNINGTAPAQPTTSGTYKVKVTANALHVRKGAGVNYGIATTVRKGDVFTITQTVNSGGYTWGKLKSGAGWIALNYTTKI